MTAQKFVSLEDVLGRSEEELKALKTGEFETAKLGVIAFTAIEQHEYKQAKKDGVIQVPDGTGGMRKDIDDDKMMVKVILAAVAKDTRSTFTFANKDLLTKLGVGSADGVVTKLLSPGEILRMAVEIQDLSGFTDKIQKQAEVDVKNS